MAIATFETEGTIPYQADNEVPSTVGDHTRGVDIATSTIVDVETSIMKAVDYVEGSNWSVDYYGQVAKKDDMVTDIDFEEHITANSYFYIQNIEVKVTSPITSTKDETFTAILPLGVRPILGDIIVAQGGSGIVGMYSITDKEIHSHALGAIYTITCKLYALFSETPTLFDNLKDKVIRNYRFNREFGTTRIIESTVFVQLQSYREFLTDIVNQYDEHLGNTGYLSYEGIHDAVMSELYLRVATSYYRPMFNIREISSTNVLEHSLFNALIYGARVNAVRNKCAIASAPSEAPSYKGMESISTVATSMLAGIIIPVAKDGTPNNVTRHATLPQHVEDDTYHVTKAFYDADTENMSPYELALYNIAQKEIIHNLDDLIEAYNDYTTEERYYYAPGLMFMLLYSIGK